MTKISFQKGLELILPWVVLLILGIFTYARFWGIPYTGFDFNPSNGEITDLFVPQSGDVKLLEGDRLIQVGPLSWTEFRRDSSRSWLSGLQNGQGIPITIQRGEQEIDLVWILPGINLPEITARLVNLWILAYIFWMAGTASLTFLRPKDTRWALLVAFFYLTALWLITGSISRWQLWKSAILTRSVVWLCLPVYWHLHWIFPRSFGRIPPVLLWGGYLIGFILAGLEWVQVLPRSLYYLGFILAILGVLILLMVHYIVQPVQRRTVGLMAAAFAAAILPTLATSIGGLFSSRPAFSGGSLLALPIIPLIYFFVVYRRQLGGLEIRANRVISTYLFAILLVSAFLVLISLSAVWGNYLASQTSSILLFSVLAAVTTAVAYPYFKNYVERRLLGIPLPQDNLVEAYSGRIATSLELGTLLRILREELLPSLLIRQSALLYQDENDFCRQLLVVGVAQEDVPDEQTIAGLLESVKNDASFLVNHTGTHSTAWIRLILPMVVNQRRTGYWLLGSRAPDDYYSQSEYPVFNTLANQTAIALTNISQSRQLLSLYQSDIDRNDKERTKLARDLHDDVLNRLIILGMNLDLKTVSTGFQEAYHELIEYTRQAISGLRPPMLDYGLQVALEEMVDEMADRPENHMQIKFEMPVSTLRYDPTVEQHIYRIVQQACENALRHSHAKVITVRGNLTPPRIDLRIEDDGAGFEISNGLDLNSLLSSGHFGLVGMLERARLVDAEIKFHSMPDRGTCVSISWDKKELV